MSCFSLSIIWGLVIVYLFLFKAMHHFIIIFLSSEALMKDIDEKYISTNEDDFNPLYSERIGMADQYRNDDLMFDEEDSSAMENQHIKMHFSLMDGQFYNWQQNSQEIEELQPIIQLQSQKNEDEEQFPQQEEDEGATTKKRKQQKKQIKKIRKCQLNSFEKQMGNKIRLKKSVNVPKTVGRILMDRFKEYQTDFKDHPEYFCQLEQELTTLSKWVKQSKKNSFKLVNLTQLFNNPQKQPQQGFLNRLVMRKMLAKCLRKEIIPNNQVKTKLEYLMAMKVYSLRCGNSKLATRMQMR